MFVYNLRMGLVSRREFFGASAAAVMTTARSYAEIKGANERLRVGVIGCGGQAMGHMRALKRNKDTDNVETIAVCDVYDKRLDQAAELTGGKKYTNYHELLSTKTSTTSLLPRRSTGTRRLPSMRPTPASTFTARNR